MSENDIAQCSLRDCVEAIVRKYDFDCEATDQMDPTVTVYFGQWLPDEPRELLARRLDLSSDFKALVWIYLFDNSRFAGDGVFSVRVDVGIDQQCKFFGLFGRSSAFSTDIGDAFYQATLSLLHLNDRNTHLTPSLVGFHYRDT